MELDVRGLICPMPVLKTKKALEELPEGKRLTVIGDYKPALENIKRFAETHGYKVVSIENSKDAFKVVIEK
ncbi:MAG TPA: sulfurtransferase TusA family protein [Methanothermococcus okinawensis]|nr:sulfurtransferase TusA family protein [Methanothermococcus okinawensis]